ncbi:TPA: hypothetical protein HA246_03430 [Candidatus Woesearchaeota archaeon]|nr:hypothetical protein [Candidatus Woesearchaeota archaeon]
MQDADFDDADFDDADYDDEEDSISEYSHLFHQIEWYHQSFYNLVVILDYFMSYAKGFRKLREMGASIVFPEIVNNKGVRLCDIREAVNPLLYAGTNIPNPKIPNDILSSEFSTLRLITGENEYGKSFYIMARGIFQAFGQAGLPVIAKSARMTLVDKILANIGLTHDVLHAKSTYKVINSTTYELAKLARGRSLMILDEPTSGTYDLKAVVQGKAYIEGIAEAGNEAWVVTHHLELAETAKRYPNAEVLTTETRDGKPTYRIVSGIFQPTEATVHLDYPKEMLRASMSGDYATRLRKLMEKEGISAEHRERLENMLGRIEIKS